MNDLPLIKKCNRETILRGLTKLHHALFVAVVLFTGVAAAQSYAEQAGNAMCETGAGQLIGFVLGAVAVGLVLVGIFRGVIAWNKIGSARENKKREGYDQAKGAGITMGGAFFPAILGAGLEIAGIPTLSCLELSNVIGVVVPVLPF